jgi:modulator of FtsH protease HflK
VRKVGPPSEIARLAAPIAGLLDAAWQRMHWWVALMAVLYAFSGVTIVKPDEVAVVLRWGRLVGETPALQQHGPGLLFAFPKPIDEVVRVQVKHVWEVSVTTLAPASFDFDAQYTMGGLETLDPIKQGYALTGDQNIVQANMVARYRISDPAEWAFYGAKAEDVLRVEVTAAMVRSLGEMGVDRVLSDGRKTLIAVATRRAQMGLDASHSGLELTSLELTRLAPPSALAGDFDAVQSAFVESQTAQNKAQAFAQSAIPQAQAEADRGIQSAHAEADSELASARGEANAFRSLEREYRANPAVIRERLYRDAIEKAISSAGTVLWVPPPVGGNYHGFRLSITPPVAGERPSRLTPSRLRKMRIIKR